MWKTAASKALQPWRMLASSRLMSTKSDFSAINSILLRSLKEHFDEVSKMTSSGVTNTHSEVRLGGINVIVGKQGESCDTVCKSNGQLCVPSKLVLLNQCEIMQKYMGCRGACLASIGADQPAEVVDDAPRYLNPGACLYTKQHSILSCNGSHKHTRRLCPCA